MQDVRLYVIWCSTLSVESVARRTENRPRSTPCHTQPLKDEHAELILHVSALATAGDAVGHVRVAELRTLVDDSYEFLHDGLIPHARAEEAALYPAVQRIAGSPDITATMQRDHVEVGALTAELADLRRRLATTAELDDDFANRLRRVLYGLHHIVKLHFAKEEEVYLPILEAGLTDTEAKQMFAGMQAASHNDAHS
jgi:iron-sulfur cluster repair protein YtfE (RIC family)